MRVYVYLYGLTEDQLDLEYWTESACLARAAADVFGESNVTMAGKHEADAWVLEEDDVLLGTVPEPLLRQKFAWPDAYSHGAATRYACNPAFEAVAGRRVLLADLPGKDMRPGHRITDRVATLRADGVERILLKWMAEAKKVGNLILEPDDDPHEAVRDWLGWEAIHFEGQQDAVLVQEYLPMQREARFFVIDGRIVTGSGKVPEATPLTRFARELRGTSLGHRRPSEWWDYSTDGQRLAPEPRATCSFAGKAAHELASADPGMRDFVIDVATTERGPVVVELNPVTRSGLFASNPYWIVEAIAEAVKSRAAVRAP